jgi:hypothetical protein
MPAVRCAKTVSFRNTAPTETTNRKCRVKKPQVKKLIEWPKRYALLDARGRRTEKCTPIMTQFARHDRLLSIAEKKAKKRNAKVENYQREHLKGFTTRELMDIDVISDRTMKLSSLTGPVLELFRRWESEENAIHGTGHGRDRAYYFDQLLHQPTDIEGPWVMENLLVNKAMQPVLRIATYMLESQHIIPWFSDCKYP